MKGSDLPTLSRKVNAEAKEDAQEAAAEAEQIATIYARPLLQAVNPSGLAQETLASQTLQLALQHIRIGWPAKRPADPAIQRFNQVRDGLKASVNFIDRDNRAVIPPPLQQTIYQNAHEWHCGIEKAKQRCRQCDWWQGMDHQIAEYISHCTA